jgi:hypothetical protein
MTEPLNDYGRKNLHQHDLIPFQVGEALFPRIDFDFSGISWEWRDTAKSAHMLDGVIDPWKRSPIGKGEFTMSGKMRAENSRAVKQYFDADYKDEIDLLKLTQGTRVPVIFWRPPAKEDWLDDYLRPTTYGDAFTPTPGSTYPAVDGLNGNPSPSSITNGLCGIPQPPPSGTWLWGFAKITSVKTQTSMQTVTGSSSAVTITGYLVEPLREVAWQFWRWGYPPPSRPAFTTEEMTMIMCSNIELFYAPHEPPPCCDKQRWWYRDPRNLLTDCRIAGYRDFVGYNVFSISGSSSDAAGIPIGGNFDPAVKIKSYNAGNLRIKNMRYGYIEIPLQGNEVVSSNGEAWMSDNSPNPERSLFPKMSPQEVNWITFDGVADIGIMERWL